MEIIPVIDVMKGIVVHAHGGKRKNYQALQSTLTVHTCPHHVVADIIKFYPFKTIYIADLDAISGHIFNWSLYRQLTQQFAHIVFWLDAGIRTRQQWQRLHTNTTMVPVIASESLTELDLLYNMKQSILSLDFKHGVFLGKEELLREPRKWPDNVIVMDLDAVGNNVGPNIDLLQQITTARADSNIILAGGVRHKRDLLTLRHKKTSAVLIASALHNGKIDRATLKSLQQ